MNINISETSTLFTDTLIFLFYELRAALVGGVGIGLFLGAIYFFGYLIHLSRLPKDDRKYKQQSHLL